MCKFLDLNEKQRQQQTVLWELITTEVAYIKMLKVVTDVSKRIQHDARDRMLMLVRISVVSGLPHRSAVEEPAQGNRHGQTVFEHYGHSKRERHVLAQHPFPAGPHDETIQKTALHRNHGRGFLANQGHLPTLSALLHRAGQMSALLQGEFEQRLFRHVPRMVREPERLQ